MISCHPTPAQLASIQDLYDTGQMLQAYQAAVKVGPLPHWEGELAEILAGRLCHNLGADQLGGIIHWRAWRKNKTSPDLVAYRAHQLLRTRGGLLTLQFCENYGKVAPTTPPRDVAHLLSIKALSAGNLRDFRMAQRFMDEAMSLLPEDPWLFVIQSSLLEMQDRYEEALAKARHTLTLRPWYRPGVQAVAHLLQVLDRKEEALVFLREANANMENLHVAGQLLMIELEENLLAEAERTLQRYIQLAPLLDKRGKAWAEIQAILINCRRGNLEKAAGIASKRKEPYYQELAARIQANHPSAQRILDVPFVRQHHLTCAPATLAAISSYWQRPARHLDIAEKICYDGTPAQSERNWAITEGWVVREFTVTWESAKALIDRGVPFTLTTSGATMGHLQAVVGYDEIRRSLWIRDPFIYSKVEFFLQSLLEQNAANGPRGMAMVPSDKARLLDNLALSDSTFYDLLLEAESELERHNRAGASIALQRLQELDPTHRLTLTCARAIAAYDANTPAILAAVEGLLKQFPNDPNLNLCRLSCLRDLSRRADRIEVLETLIKKPGTAPVFWQMYAEELRADSRQLPAAKSWVNWALRYAPDANTISSAAHILWQEGKFQEAVRYYRIAACLGEKKEQFARTYFIASQHIRGTEATLEFLKDRWDRFGGTSPEPAMTWVQSLQQAGKIKETREALTQSLKRLPDNGDLKLFAADFYARFAEIQTAKELLQASQSTTSSGKWRRTAARLAEYSAEKAEALGHWRSILIVEPLAHDCLAAVAGLLSEIEGIDSTLKFLEERCIEFPKSCPLLALRAEWLKRSERPELKEALLALLEANPVDDWAWRELALFESGQGDFDAALNAANEALNIDPRNSFSHSTKAAVLLAANKIPQARECLQQALKLNVNNDYAIAEFVRTGPTVADRQAALAIVSDELREQVIFGTALLTYKNVVRGSLNSLEVLSLLEAAHQARPDLWQSWQVLIIQLLEIGRSEEAAAKAIAACEMFPLIAELWLEKGRALGACGKQEEEIAALEKALQITPGYADAAMALSERFLALNEQAKARRTLEKAIANSPTEVRLLGCLARLNWYAGEKLAAIETLKKTTQLEPGYQFSWETIKEWAQQSGDTSLPRECALALTKSRPGEARSWLIFAEMLEDQAPVEQVLNALNKALDLSPQCEAAYDRKARILARLGHINEALACCRPSVFSRVPPALALREAWIEKLRGNLQRAIDLAIKLSTECPEYAPCWQALAEWYGEDQNLNAATNCAIKLCDLAPLSAVPLGYLGDLKEKAGDTAGAAEAYEKAFALDPYYQFAGLKLFQFHIKRKQLESASKVLSALRNCVQPSTVTALEIQLACEQSEKPKALELFSRLCTDPHVTDWDLNDASNWLIRFKLQRKWKKVLFAAAATDSCLPAVARFWVRQQTGAGNWGIHRKFEKLNRAAQIEALTTYSLELAQAIKNAALNEQSLSLYRLRSHAGYIDKFATILRSSTMPWGAAACVLAELGLAKKAVEWMADWKTRTDTQPWMLLNLAEMLRRLGRYHQAHDVVLHLITVGAGQYLSQALSIAAFEEALTGQRESAQLRLSGLADKGRSVYELLAKLLVSLPPQMDRESFKELQYELKLWFRPVKPFKHSPDTREAFVRFEKAILSRGKTFGRWLWFKWFYRGGDWIWLFFLVITFPFLLSGCFAAVWVYIYLKYRSRPL